MRSDRDSTASRGPPLRWAPRLESAADPGNLAAAENEDHQREGECGEGEPEQEPAIPLNGDAQASQVRADGTRHKASSQESAKHGRPGVEQENHRDRLEGARRQTAPRLHPERLEDKDRFGGSQELEIEGLAKNCRDD